jgi:hypothetical protein
VNTVSRSLHMIDVAQASSEQVCVCGSLLVWGMG